MGKVDSMPRPAVPQTQHVKPPKVKQTEGKLSLEMSPEQGQQIAGASDSDFCDAIIQQIALTTPGREHSVGPVNAGLAALAGIQPRDELEGMLATQMVAVHNMALEMSKRALLPEQTVEGVSENVSRASRLMRTFCAQVEALQRYRNAGQSTVTVQHVTVGEGGQAVIGNVGRGGRGDG